MARHFAMTHAALDGVVSRAVCRVLGWQEASHDSQRTVIAALSVDLTDAASTILCEPSLARKSTRPPDVVLVDQIAGLHLVEVKGVSLEQIEALEPGGQFRIRYENAVHARNPFAQVRNAMFDIKDADGGAHLRIWRT